MLSIFIIFHRFITYQLKLIMATVDQSLKPQQKPIRTQLESQVYALDLDETKIVKNPTQTYFAESKIRQMYLIPGIKPYHFCSYAGFARVFPAPNIYEAYRSENLNIIDMHLRYHQFIHEKLAIYKWVPSFAIMAAFKFRPLSLLFPIFFTNIVDFYFKDFLIWKYSKQKMINIRSQFTTKLSKQKTGQIYQGEFCYFPGLKMTQLKPNYKFLRKNTHYIFHTRVKGIEESSVCLTPFFENYMNLRTVNFNMVNSAWDQLQNIFSEFKVYKKLENKKQLPVFLDRAKLLSYKDIKRQQRFNLSKQMEQRVRRFLQITKHIKDSKIYMSGFSFTDLLHLNKHYDLLTPQKFNFQTNVPDLVLFYSIAMGVGLLKLIIKRAIKM